METKEAIEQLCQRIDVLNSNLEKLNSSIENLNGRTVKKETATAAASVLDDTSKWLNIVVKELFDEYKEEEYGLPVQWLEQAITNRFNPTFRINRYTITAILKKKKMIAQNVRPSIPVGKEPNAYEPSDHITIYDRRQLYGRPYIFTKRQWGM